MTVPIAMPIKVRKQKNHVKMPSLLAFLSMFGEQMRVFGVRLQREEE